MTGEIQIVPFLLSTARSLRATPQDLRTVADLLVQEMPTVRQAVDIANERIPTFRRDYGASAQRLVEGVPALEASEVHPARPAVPGVGEVAVSDVVLADLTALRNATHLWVGVNEVLALLQDGRGLASSDHATRGHGAAQNFVTGVKKISSVLRESCGIAIGGAEQLKAPNKPPVQRRALTPREVEQVERAVVLPSRDPELDELIVEFLRVTAARREGVEHLRLCQLLPERPGVLVTGKFGKIYSLPMSRTRLQRLDSFARARGAAGPNDHVFRYPDSSPVLDRRWDTINGRMKDLPWARVEGVSVHWLRHTGATRLEEAGFSAREVARWLNHARKETTDTYLTDVSFERLCQMHEAVIGPLD